jgi:hypothetical protein
MHVLRTGLLRWALGAATVLVEPEKASGCCLHLTRCACTVDSRVDVVNPPGLSVYVLSVTFPRYPPVRARIARFWPT